MKNNFLIISTIIMLATTGCATHKKTPPPIKKDSPESVVFMKAMASAAKDASNALKEMAIVNNAAKLPDLTSNRMRQQTWQANMIPEGLERQVSIDQMMSVSQFVRFVQSLVKRDDYHVLLLGRTPIPEPILDLRDKKMKIIDLLQDVGAQLDVNADLIIIPHRKDKQGLIKVVFRED